MNRKALIVFSSVALAFGRFAEPFAQCGGAGWTGPTICQEKWFCKFFNADYSQCRHGGFSSPGAVLISTPTSTASVPALTGVAVSAPLTLPPKNVGRLPALGWNSWNAFRFDINEEKLMAAANSFVTLGLKDAGYVYVNIDDAWPQRSRDNVTNRLVPDFAKFPSGIDGVADKIHDLGLKIGIYSDAGPFTCGGFPASLGHEVLDAQTFSEWGIDYLKYDNCNIPGNWTDDATPQLDDWYNSNSAIRYRYMTDALASVSRPIEYNLCIWGTAQVTEWGARVGHSWRVWFDSTPTWDYLSFIINLNAGVLSSTDFFGHNDMDMMEIGNGNLTIQEVRTHFAAWIFMKSPILLGTDLTQLSDAHLAIIKNAELLAFHQDDKIGKPAIPFTAFDGMPATSPPEYYTGASSKGTHVFIINTSNDIATKQFNFSSIPGLNASSSFQVHDMWTGEDLPETFSSSSTFTVDVEAHDTVAYFIIPL